MPLEVDTNRESGRLIVRASGALEDRDIEGLVAQLDASGDAAALDALYDYRDVTDVSRLSSDMVRRLGEIQSCDPELASRRRVAIVASSDALFGLGRMYALGRRVKLSGVEVFRCVEDAHAYLEQRPDPSLAPAS